MKLFQNKLGLVIIVYFYISKTEPTGIIEAAYEIAQTQQKYKISAIFSSVSSSSSIVL